MNIRDLTYLVALAETTHFGKAAEKCFVSQPALSMQIKKLETYLGVTLLERTNKSVMLTAIGKDMAERARIILQQTQEMREIAKSAADPYCGQLKLGIFPTLAPYLLPHIIAPISKQFPNIAMYLVENQTASLIEELQAGKIDAAILALPVSDAGFSSTVLFAEEFLLAVAKNHPLAKSKTVKPDKLAEHELLLLDEGHCLREQALSFCQRVSAQETTNFRATSLETLRHMVAAGLGMTLIPKLACKANDNVAYIPFHSSKPSRTLGLVWRKTHPKGIVLEEMGTLIKKIMAKG